MSKLRVAVLALLLAACGGDESASGISREKFIRANVALRTVSDTAPQVDSLRARALRKEKVTPAQLRAWLKEHERNTVLMAETWTEISKRVQAADSARRPPPPVPPTGGPPPSFPPGGPEIAPPPPSVTPVPAPQPPPPAVSQSPEPPPVLARPKVRDTASAPDSAGQTP
jgi:hypothetical protein